MVVSRELSVLSPTRIHPFPGGADGSRARLQSRTNLPAYASTFVGRDDEIAGVATLLRDARLVTLTGPGGVGKTRLSVEVGRECASRFKDGAWFADIATELEGDRVACAVLNALNLTRPGSRRANLVDRLRPYEILLILDNCEHLAGGCAAVVESLLEDCRGITVLATSRHPLGVAGERLWSLSPLGIPALDDLDSQAVAQSEAVRLFVERAQEVCPRFRLDAAVAPAVAEICRRLDGLPLAVELAAARLSVLSPAEIAARLDDPLRLLRGRAGSRRHLSLRATLDWSHDLLNPAEEVLMRRLAVFGSGWTLAAAENVCSGGVVGDQVPSLLELLIAKSLVVADWDGDAPRYRLLETVRCFYLEKLERSGEMKVVQARHAEWLLDRADAADRERRGRCDEASLVISESAEAVDVGECRDVGFLVHNLIAAGQAKLLSGDPRQARACFEQCLALPSPDEPDAASSALIGLGRVAFFEGDLEGAETALRQCVELALQTNHREARSAALNLLGDVECVRGDYIQARSLIGDAIELAGDAKPALSVARCTQSLARVLQCEGSPAEASALYAESLDLAWPNEAQDHRVRSLLGLAETALAAGNARNATSAFERALAEAVLSGDVRAKSSALGGLSLVALAHGELDRAVKLRREALECQYRSGDLLNLVVSLEAWARLALMGDRYEVAVCLIGAARAARDRTGAMPSRDEAREVDDQLALARTALAADALAEAWAQGKQLAPAEAAASALRGKASLRGQSCGWDSLSDAERDVVRLVTTGMTNQEIGMQLVISGRTVSTHLTRIYRKLGVGSRRDLAGVADMPTGP